MKAIIGTIPHEKQRYPTCGDWQMLNPKCPQEFGVIIDVSSLSCWQHEFLVALHELVESALCKQAGVTAEAVDDFDMEFEKNRQPGDESEPGDHPNAPYHFAHLAATNIERQIATLLHVDWEKYEEELNALP